MKIKKVELKYFKFHKDLIIDFDSKNLLIYGENGAGKSSIYEALYSNFYHKKRLDKYFASNIQETYKNRNFPTENLEVNIQFNNGQVLNRNENKIDDLNILNVEKQIKKLPYSFEPTIYFANEKVLNRLTKENFYIALNETLFEHFPQMKSQYTSKDENYHFKRFSQFNNLEMLKKKIIEKIGNNNEYEIRNEFEKIIKSENKSLEFVFNSMFPTNEINKIINEYLDENFKISFEITPAKSGNSDILEFNPPIIKIKIDEIEYDGKLSQHFNEAKLKLIGIAIYFALAKKYEIQQNEFRLLVLDDFLTSLDMANRKLIIKYILEEFKDYQKIILTHNLQFFNMITKMIHLDSEDEENWKIQKLFVYNNQAFLYDKSISYLTDAENRIQNGDLQSAGNFIRKEFEKVINEFEQLLELGVVEESKNIINTLVSEDKFYVKASINLNSFCENIQRALTCSDTEQQKLGYINSALNKVMQTQINFQEVIKNSDGTESTNSINSIIKKGKFYQNFILHPASHHDINTEIYKKECLNGINLLKYLNYIITNLKGNSYQ